MTIDLRMQQTPVRDKGLAQGAAFGAESTVIGRMVRIASHLDLAFFIFIEDDPATNDVIEADFPETGRERRDAVIEVVDINIGGAIQDIIDAGGENIEAGYTMELGGFELTGAIVHTWDANLLVDGGSKEDDEETEAYVSISWAFDIL